MLVALAVSAGAAGLAHCRPARGQGKLTAPLDQSRSIPAGTPKAWVDKAAEHELAIIQQDEVPLRYRTRKIDHRGDTTRVVIESQQGTVARLVERNGQPLTAAEDAAERSRLNDILTSPNDFLKHKRHDEEGRNYVIQLVKASPSAMLFSYVPGQPQPPGVKSPQVVIDFTPDPSFRPATLITEALTGLAGRLWIDQATGHLTRIEGRILRPVNVGWGLVAKVYPGGTVEFEQTCVDGRHWVSSHLAEDVTLREMMVRTVNDKTLMSAWNFELLPEQVPFQDAVHQLLGMQVPLR